MTGLPPFIPVAEQIEPDMQFPTVDFPNPEEGKAALDLAIRLAGARRMVWIVDGDGGGDGDGDGG